MVGGALAIPLIYAPALCITDDVVKAELYGTVFFMAGLTTIIQTMFGSRYVILSHPDANMYLHTEW